MAVRSTLWINPFYIICDIRRGLITQYLIHFHSSFNVGFLPCMRIPTRYILPANHTTTANVAMSIPSDRAISHVGMSYGMRAIITIGDVSGIIENQNASSDVGSLMTESITNRLRMMGMVTGVCNCCASCGLSTDEPMAANRAA